MSVVTYHALLGHWVLDPASCVYEQGDPPKYESHSLAVEDNFLVIGMNRTDAKGEIHNLTLRVPADGSRAPFNGGLLADEIGISFASGTSITVSAFRKDIELMVAERALSADGAAMTLIQSVNLPDGTTPENRATFRRLQ